MEPRRQSHQPQKAPRQDLDEGTDLQLALLPAFHRGRRGRSSPCWLLLETTESWDSIFETCRSTLGGDTERSWLRHRRKDPLPLRPPIALILGELWPLRLRPSSHVREESARLLSAQL